MKLANIFTEEELGDFFQTEPILDEEPAEREFFETRTFRVEDGPLVLFCSVDLYTVGVTLELLEATKPRLTMSFDLASGRIAGKGSSRTLELVSAQGFVVLVHLPELKISVIRGL